MKVEDRVQKLLDAKEIKLNANGTGWAGMRIPMVSHAYRRRNSNSDERMVVDKDGDPAVAVINKARQLKFYESRGWKVAPVPVKKPTTRRKPKSDVDTTK
jgi:hypothetical protein